MPEKKTQDSIAAIVPALNERAGVAPTVHNLVEIFDQLGVDYEIIVVDDGSTDGTSDQVRPLLEANPRIRLIRHEVNQGLASSFLEGVALAKSKYCIKVPGDNNDPKESLIRIFEQRGQADMVIPYFVNMEDRTLFRRTVSRLYTWLVNAITGYRLLYWNGDVLHNTAVLKTLEVKTKSFGFHAECILLQLDSGCSYVEVPTRCDFQEAGSHAFKPKNVLGVGWFLVRMFFRYRVLRGSAQK